jgi:hypothetical protein
MRDRYGSRDVLAIVAKLHRVVLGSSGIAGRRNGVACGLVEARGRSVHEARKSRCSVTSTSSTLVDSMTYIFTYNTACPSWEA